MTTRAVLCFVAGAMTLSSGLARAADPVDFEKQIKPILVQSCYKCHAGAKHKGDLKLASVADIMKGGKDGLVLTSKDPEKSDIYHRITLPRDDDERMPPKGEPLPKEQVELVKQWIVQGATFGSWKEASTEEIAKAVGTGGAGAEEATTQAIKEIPLPKVAEANAQAVEKLQQTGALCMKLAQDTNLLDVEFQLNGPNISDAQVPLLAPLAEQVYWLNLANTKVTDSGLAPIAQLKNLRRLHLEKTQVTDAGLTNIKGLTNLDYLNLYGTNVTDAGIAQLAGLKNLKELYVWQSKVTDAGAQSLRKQAPQLMVNNGWQESASATPAPVPAATPAPAPAK